MFHVKHFACRADVSIHEIEWSEGERAGNNVRFL
jgi:hypothetical protein